MVKSTYFRSRDRHPPDWHPDAPYRRRRTALDPWPELVELAAIAAYKGVVKVWGWAKGMVAK
jgi:hypothetical protein